MDLTSLSLFIKSVPNDQMEDIPGRHGLLASLFLSILPLRKMWRKAFGSNCRKFVRPRDTVDTASNVNAAFNYRGNSCTSNMRKYSGPEKLYAYNQRNDQWIAMSKQEFNSVTPNALSDRVTYLLTGSDFFEPRSDFLVSFKTSLTRTESGSRRRNPEMFAPPCLNSSKSNSSKDFKYNKDNRIRQLSDQLPQIAAAVKTKSTNNSLKRVLGFVLLLVQRFSLSSFSFPVSIEGFAHRKKMRNTFAWKYLISQENKSRKS